MGSKKDQATGQVKEKTGEAVGDEGLAQAGRREQMKGDVKASAKKLKHAVKKM